MFGILFPNGPVILPICRVYYTYQILMPLDLIDCIYSLSRVFKYLSVYPIYSLNISQFTLCTF